MKIQLLKETDYTVSRWSGGTTTEIAIGPAGACYQERDFLWRISSASVDLEESAFTDLPDYERWIVTLDRPISLRHNDNAPLALIPFEVHRFDGADATASVGRCTDFNLMLRKNSCAGRLQAVTSGQTEKELSLLTNSGAGLHKVYLYGANGSLQVRTETETIVLCEKESLLLQGNLSAPIRIASETDAAVIVAEIIE